MYHLQKTNDFTFDKVKTGKQKKILHEDLFGMPYFTAFLCGKTGSGKTSLLYNILKSLVFLKDTTIIIVSSTLENDPIMGKIIEKFSKHNEVLTFDHLDESIYDQIMNVISENEEHKKYIYAKTIIIFDDIKENLRDKKFYDIVSKVRHFFSHIFILSQYYKDITPNVRDNLSYVILFPGFQKEALLKMHNMFISYCDPEEFIAIYNNACDKEGTCLLCDLKKSEFKKNMSLKYIKN